MISIISLSDNYVKEIHRKYPVFFRLFCLKSSVSKMFVFRLLTKHMKFYKFSTFSITALKIFFIFYTMKEDIKQIKKMLLLFPKKILLAPMGHFGPEYDASLEFWICFKDFLKIFHNERGQESH